MADSSHLTPLKLEEFLPYKLSILSNKVSATIAQTYKSKFGLSVTEWRIMAVLGEFPDISADEVSSKTQIEKSIISRSVSRLLQRELLQRDFDSEDRRKSVLRLSKIGESVYYEVVPISHSYQNALMSCFDSEEATLFIELIEKLHMRVKSIDKQKISEK